MMIKFKTNKEKKVKQFLSLGLLLFLFMFFSMNQSHAQKPDDVFEVVEDMPRFPGCEDIDDKTEKRKCAQELLLEFIDGNMDYPDEAWDNEIQGTVVVRFIVNKDGTLSNFRLLKDIGSGCGEEALRIMKLMNEMSERWIPGKVRGKEVRVYNNYPIKFRL